MWEENQGPYLPASRRCQAGAGAFVSEEEQQLGEPGERWLRTEAGSAASGVLGRRSVGERCVRGNRIQEQNAEVK